MPGMEMLIPPWASITGSRWLGPPCLRMQLAHSTRAPPASPFDSVAPVLEVEPVAVRGRGVVTVTVLAAELDVVEVVVLSMAWRRAARLLAAQSVVSSRRKLGKRPAPKSK
jgi:hypothetical protein